MNKLFCLTVTVIAGNSFLFVAGHQRQGFRFTLSLEVNQIYGHFTDVFRPVGTSSSTGSTGLPSKSDQAVFTTTTQILHKTTTQIELLILQILFYVCSPQNNSIYFSLYFLNTSMVYRARTHLPNVRLIASILFCQHPRLWA